MAKTKKMKVVYVAGAYRASNIIKQIFNIRKARNMSIKLWRKGIATICPHMNTAFVEYVNAQEKFLVFRNQRNKRSSLKTDLTGN